MTASEAAVDLPLPSPLAAADASLLHPVPNVPHLLHDLFDHFPER